MVELPCTVNNSDIIFELKTVPFEWMLLKIGIPQDHLFLCLYIIYETTIVGYVQIIFNHVNIMFILGSPWGNPGNQQIKDSESPGCCSASSFLPHGSLRHSFSQKGPEIVSRARSAVSGIASASGYVFSPCYQPRVENHIIVQDHELNGFATKIYFNSFSHGKCA